MSFVASILSLCLLALSIIGVIEAERDYTLYMTLMIGISTILLGFSVLSTIHAFKKK